MSIEIVEFSLGQIKKRNNYPIKLSRKDYSFLGELERDENIAMAQSPNRDCITIRYSDKKIKPGMINGTKLRFDEYHIRIVDKVDNYYVIIITLYNMTNYFNYYFKLKFDCSYYTFEESFVYLLKNIKEVITQLWT